MVLSHPHVCIFRRSSRKRTVYCLNEMELVDYAVEIINKSKMQLGKEERNTKMIPEDVEIADTPPSPVLVSQSPKLPVSPATNCETTTMASRTHSENDDDPLKFVREIFFS
ncbi:cell cycle regulator of non-homologous end joining isoform X2 [Pelobates fuscus]|uniref:cell cycle regulator of non-homologous end joining isoform X2 n=1 Tax=Pelobates fuscus TaxID=191477 RepID=UPI002FE42D6F